MGEPVQMTSDQAQRAAAALLKSEGQAAERSLLGALAQATGAAFEEAMALNRSGRTLPRGVPIIVDAEIVSEEDAGVVAPSPAPPPSRPVPPIPIEDASAEAPVESPSEPPVEVVVEPVPSSTDERRGGYREKRDA